MRGTFLGAIAVLCGAAIVASGVLDRSPSPDPATAAGELMALAVGALLVATGGRALLRRPHRPAK